jgi:diaminohydroxyphosphoribosylaminopyrimidine deaminase / 5-amino-6-(5-phosphoribosylamino)uracil reductase
VTYMERALELAERGRRTTTPNPVVGAVLVRDGKVVGEGWHERPGEAHAEVRALEDAGDAARGATLYVTLEPCSHHGRTPPCADAIVAAGVARVVVGTGDPNPEVNGAGIARLRAGDVDVEVEDGFAARAANAGYFSVHRRGRPWVALKLATTLDGGLAVPGRRWVAGEAARRRVHELRARVDAVGVGTGTVRADAPRLDARGVGAARQPRRLAFGTSPLPAGSELELRNGELEQELHALAGEGIQTLLLEGGARLAASFLDKDLVDEVWWFVAPVIGGDPKLPVFAGPVELRHSAIEQFDGDVLISGYVHDP